MHCEIHDTSGDDNLSNQRKVLYKGTDVFMICVAVNRQASFDNIEKWRKEIQAVETDKPIVLLLTKSDIVDKEVTIKDLKNVRKQNKYYAGVE